MKAMTKTNDRAFASQDDGWVDCNCVQCGVWYKAYRPTTAGGLCPRCKEELYKETQSCFYDNWDRRI